LPQTVYTHDELTYRKEPNGNLSDSGNHAERNLTDCYRTEDELAEGEQDPHTTLRDRNEPERDLPNRDHPLGHLPSSAGVSSERHMHEWNPEKSGPGFPLESA